MIPFLLTLLNRFTKTSAFLLSIIILSSVSCSGTLRQSDFQNELDIQVRRVGENMDLIPELKDKRTAGAGYFYILDREGHIFFHPKEVLSGADMSSFSFVKRILEAEHGCISFYAEGNVTVVFFRRINQMYTMCLAVPGDRIADRCDCMFLNVSD